MDEMNLKAYSKLSKKELIENIDQLNKDCDYWAKETRRLRTEKFEADQAAATPKRPIWGWKFGSVAIDFWPPTEWFRFRWSPWKPGRYAQLCIGPIRIDWADG